MNFCKLLLYNYSSVFGGQERYAEQLIENLPKKGFAVSFVGSPSILGEKTQPIADQSNKNRVELLNGNRALYKKALRFPKAAFWVYVQHSSVNDGQGSSWKRIVRKCLLWLLLNRVDLVVRVCDNALPEYYASGKVKTIYNGVKLPEFTPFVPPQKNIKLLMVGGINSNKNQRLAIETLVHYKHATLTIVGSGEQQEYLEQLAAYLGVAERVKWVGFVNNPELYYKDADLLLLLSKFEAFPYVVLEAMSYSTPVIASPVGGVPEIIQHNKNGWLFNSNSSVVLATMINDIHRDNEHLELVGKEARETIEAKFTVDNMVSNLVDEINNRMELSG